MSKTRKIRGQESIQQRQHHDSAAAQTTTAPVLAPGEIVTPADLAASPGLALNNGVLLRVKVAGDTYVQISDADITAAPGAATPDALLIDASVNGGWHLIRVCKDNLEDARLMVRFSAAPARAENLGQ